MRLALVGGAADAAASDGAALLLDEFFVLSIRAAAARADAGDTCGNFRVVASRDAARGRGAARGRFRGKKGAADSGGPRDHDKAHGMRRTVPHVIFSAGS